jgi:hypothetical protein
MKANVFGQTTRQLNLRDVRSLHALCRGCGGWGFVVERWGDGKWRQGYFIAESIDAKYDSELAKRVLEGVGRLRITLKETS